MLLPTEFRWFRDIGVDLLQNFNHFNIAVHKDFPDRVHTVLVRIVPPVVFRPAEIFFLVYGTVKAVAGVSFKNPAADADLRDAPDRTADLREI